MHGIIHMKFEMKESVLERVCLEKCLEIVQVLSFECKFSMQLLGSALKVFQSLSAPAQHVHGDSSVQFTLTLSSVYVGQRRYHYT